MRKFAIATALAIVAFVLVAFYIARNKAGMRGHAAPISSITFDQIDRAIRANPGDADVEKYSKKLAGTRVRWSGVVTKIDSNGTVYLATNVYPADVQFQVSRDLASALRSGQKVRLVGTVDRVTDAETFPPMFHTYILLKDVELKGSTH